MEDKIEDIQKSTQDSKEYEKKFNTIDEIDNFLNLPIEAKKLFFEKKKGSLELLFESEAAAPLLALGKAKAEVWTGLRGGESQPILPEKLEDIKKKIHLYEEELKTIINEGIRGMISNLLDNIETNQNNDLSENQDIERVKHYYTLKNNLYNLKFN